MNIEIYHLMYNIVLISEQTRRNNIIKSRNGSSKRSLRSGLASKWKHTYQIKHYRDNITFSHRIPSSVVVRNFNSANKAPQGVKLNYATNPGQ
jgi:hypothetical protein